MLLLSRKVGERVLVGDKVVITVVRIGPNAARLGIEAPKGMPILREEILIGSIEDEQLRQSTLETHYEEMTGDLRRAYPLCREMIDPHSLSSVSEKSRQSFSFSKGAVQ